MDSSWHQDGWHMCCFINEKYSYLIEGHGGPWIAHTFHPKCAVMMGEAAVWLSTHLRCLVQHQSRNAAIRER